MKLFAIIALVLLSTSSNAGNLKITGSDGTCCTLPIEYPTNYFANTCKYNMDLITDSIMGTVANVDFVYDEPNCPTRSQYIGFDGNYYAFSTEAYLDFSGIADLLWIKQDYFNCHTVSGSSILSGGAQLVLLGNTLLFDLGTGNVNMNYYSASNIYVLSFNSANGDILCDNPVDLTGLLDTPIIFSNGFE
jgi:hypothetical protein